MFCGSMCEDDNWPLLAAGAREAKLHFSHKVRNPVAGVNPQTVTTYCLIFRCCTKMWQIDFQTCHLIYGPDKSPTMEHEATDEVVLFTCFMLFWTLWPFRFKIQMQKDAELKQRALPLPCFLSIWEPALIAFAPVPASPAAHAPLKAGEHRYSRLAHLVCYSAYRWVAR